MEIVVKIENVYGSRCIYPVCEKAKIFAELTKQKTLNNAIRDIQKLGYNIVVQAPEVRGY